MTSENGYAGTGTGTGTGTKAGGITCDAARGPCAGSQRGSLVRAGRLLPLLTLAGVGLLLLAWQRVRQPVSPDRMASLLCQALSRAIGGSVRVASLHSAEDGSTVLDGVEAKRDGRTILRIEEARVKTSLLAAVGVREDLTIDARGVMLPGAGAASCDLALSVPLPWTLEAAKGSGRVAHGRLESAGRGWAVRDLSCELALSPQGLAVRGLLASLTVPGRTLAVEDGHGLIERGPPLRIREAGARVSGVAVALSGTAGPTVDSALSLEIRADALDPALADVRLAGKAAALVRVSGTGATPVVTATVDLAGCTWQEPGCPSVSIRKGILDIDRGSARTRDLECSVGTIRTGARVALAPDGGAWAFAHQAIGISGSIGPVTAAARDLAALRPWIHVGEGSVTLEALVTGSLTAPRLAWRASAKDVQLLDIPLVLATGTVAGEVGVAALAGMSISGVVARWTGTTPPLELNARAASLTRRGALYALEPTSVTIGAVPATLSGSLGESLDLSLKTPPVPVRTPVGWVRPDLARKIPAGLKARLAARMTGAAEHPVVKVWADELSGEVSIPALGPVRLEGGRATGSSGGVRLEDVTLSMQGVTCKAGGQVGANGALDLALAGRLKAPSRTLRVGGTEVAVEGAMIRTLKVTGTLDRPSIDGDVELSGALVRVGALEGKIQSGVAALNASGVSLRGVVVLLAGGELRLSGMLPEAALPWTRAGAGAGAGPRGGSGGEGEPPDRVGSRGRAGAGGEGGGGTIDVNATFTGIPASLFSSAKGLALSGPLSGRLSARGPAASPRMQGEIQMAGLAVGSGASRFQVMSGRAVADGSGALRLDRVVLASPAGQMSVGGSIDLLSSASSARTLDLTARGQSELGTLLGLVGYAEVASGSATLELHVRGRMGSPDASGRVRTGPFLLRVGHLSLPGDGLDLPVVMQMGKVRVTDGRATVLGAAVRLSADSSKPGAVGLSLGGLDLVRLGQYLGVRTDNLTGTLSGVFGLQISASGVRGEGNLSASTLVVDGSRIQAVRNARSQLESARQAAAGLGILAVLLGGQAPSAGDTSQANYYSTLLSHLSRRHQLAPVTGRLVLAPGEASLTSIRGPCIDGAIQVDLRTRKVSGFFSRIVMTDVTISQVRVSGTLASPSVNINPANVRMGNN